MYFVLCIIESEIRRVSRWETEAVEAAAAHNVATPHILTTSPPCPQTFFFKKQTKTKKQAREDWENDTRYLKVLP